MQSNPAATVAGHEPRRFIVAAADAGRRIDAVVAESLGLGRRGATRLLQNVRRNGRRVRKGDRLTVGDEILLHDLAAMVLSERWAGTGPTPPTGSAPSNPAGGEDLPCHGMSKAMTRRAAMPAAAFTACGSAMASPGFSFSATA